MYSWRFFKRHIIFSLIARKKLLYVYRMQMQSSKIKFARGFTFYKNGTICKEMFAFKYDFESVIHKVHKYKIIEIGLVLKSFLISPV